MSNPKKLPYYVAALRDGAKLVWMSDAGVWVPWSAFALDARNPYRLRYFHNPASAIEVASHFAVRSNCGWRVEMR